MFVERQDEAYSSRFELHALLRFITLKVGMSTRILHIIDLHLVLRNVEAHCDSVYTVSRLEHYISNPYEREFSVFEEL